MAEVCNSLAFSTVFPQFLHLRPQYIALPVQTLPNALLLFLERLVSADEDTYDATGNSANERALRRVTSDSTVISTIRRANDRPDDCAPKAVHSSIERRAAPAIAR